METVVVQGGLHLGQQLVHVGGAVGQMLGFIVRPFAAHIDIQEVVGIEVGHTMSHEVCPKFTGLGHLRVSRGDIHGGIDTDLGKLGLDILHHLLIRAAVQIQRAGIHIQRKALVPQHLTGQLLGLVHIILYGQFYPVGAHTVNQVLRWHGIAAPELVHNKLTVNGQTYRLTQTHVGKFGALTLKKHYMGNIGGLHRHGKAVILEKLVPQGGRHSPEVQHPHDLLAVQGGIAGLRVSDDAHADILCFGGLSPVAVKSSDINVLILFDILDNIGASADRLLSEVPGFRVPGAGVENTACSVLHVK